MKLCFKTDCLCHILQQIYTCLMWCKNYLKSCTLRDGNRTVKLLKEIQKYFFTTNGFGILNIILTQPFTLYTKEMYLCLSGIPSLTSRKNYFYYLIVFKNVIKTSYEKTLMKANTFRYTVKIRRNKNKKSIFFPDIQNIIPCFCSTFLWHQYRLP